jgi:Tfp pilus assembly protein PilV
MKLREKSIRPQGSAEAGFTLIEALIAIVILIFGLVAVSNLFVVSLTSNNVANHTNATTAEASEIMDLLKALPFRNLPTTTQGSLTSDLPSTNTTNPRVIVDATTSVLNQYNSTRTVSGIGPIRSRWTITAVDTSTRLITVLSESVGSSSVGRSRSSAQFTTVRTATVGAALTGTAVGPVAP